MIQRAPLPHAAPQKAPGIVPGAVLVVLQASGLHRLSTVGDTNPDDLSDFINAYFEGCV